MPAAWFDAEYMFEFTEAVDSVFSYEQVMAAVAEDVEPLDLVGEERLNSSWDWIWVNPRIARP
jgi:hypothetical protein